MSFGNTAGRSVTGANTEIRHERRTTSTRMWIDARRIHGAVYLDRFGGLVRLVDGGVGQWKPITQFNAWKRDATLIPKRIKDRNLKDKPHLKAFVSIPD